IVAKEFRTILANRRTLLLIPSFGAECNLVSRYFPADNSHEVGMLFAFWDKCRLGFAGNLVGFQHREETFPAGWDGVGVSGAFCVNREAHFVVEGRQYLRAVWIYPDDAGHPKEPAAHAHGGGVRHGCTDAPAC